MSQGQDSLRATDTIYMFPFNGMIQPGCCPCVTCAPSPAVLLADPQWPPPMSTLVLAWRRHRIEALLGVWEGPALPALQPAIGTVKQISSLEFSPSCHHVARWWRKAWCLDTRGFIPKKIQWHIHAGLWSLVNWWREALMRHYIRCSWILMTAAVGLMEWPWPW